MSSSAAQGFGRQDGTPGSPCGALPDSGAIALSGNGEVTVTDRSGTIVGDGRMTGGTLVSVVSNPDGSLREQVCRVRFDLTLFAPMPDLALFEFRFEGRAAPVEVRESGLPSSGPLQLTYVATI